MANRSYDTEGTDTPSSNWMRKRVRVRTHPEWGTGKVMRWYPAGAGQPARLRVMMEGVPSPQIVSVHEVQVVE